ncbi:MAG: hypothetical protein WCC12_18780, partial [Anaerolineales bacterium]
MNNSNAKNLSPIWGNRQPFYAAHWVTSSRFGQLVLVETVGNEHEKITELITQWSLRGSFYLLAGGEWLPDRDVMYWSLRRYTVQVEEALDNPILMRPFTCFQFLDLLASADWGKKPVLLLDFLHLFYNPDIHVPVRQHVLEQCCRHVQFLSFSHSIGITVPHRAT